MGRSGPQSLIVAGNYHQYMMYIESHGLDKWMNPYISNVGRLRGYSRSTQVILVGTYYENPDWPEISERLRVFDNPALVKSL
jgi:hypothetical protein